MALTVALARFDGNHRQAAVLVPGMQRGNKPEVVMSRPPDSHVHSRKDGPAEELRSEDDVQQERLGPRGVPGEPFPFRMTPERKKKTPKNKDPGHTA